MNVDNVSSDVLGVFEEKKVLQNFILNRQPRSPPESRDGGRSLRENAEEVAELLVNQPNLSSKEVAAKTGLSKEELIEVYTYIQNNKALQDRIIYHSNCPTFTKEMSELLTYERNYVEALLKGNAVYPLILEVHLGEFCTSSCKMCFSHDIDYEERVRKEQSMKEATIMRLLEECAENNVREVWFSGGKEPLTKPIAAKVIARANELGFITKLYTNGELLTPEVRKAVLECMHVRVSLNGTREETYDKIHFPPDGKCPMHTRAGKGVFYKVKRNIAELVKLKQENRARVNIAISQIVQPDNYDELADFVRLGYGLGVNSVHTIAESVGNVREFTEEEKQAIIGHVATIMREKSEGAYGDMGIDLRGVTREELDAEKARAQFLPGMKKPEKCLSGILKRGVNPYGAVYYCEFSSHPQHARKYRHLRLGSLNEKDFGEILRENAGNYPALCSICQAHEYGLNITFEKLKQDLEYGISLQKQPYYRDVTPVALVGLGRWGGGALVNVLKDIPGVVIYGVARSTFREKKRQLNINNNIKVYPAEKYGEILSKRDIKAIIIATGVDTHYELTKEALLAGKDVFVEKPFTRTVKEAEELIAIAKERGLILTVGYEFMYDQNINKLKETIDSNVLGEVESIELSMLNPLFGKKIDKTTNVVEDIGTHQLSILQVLLGIRDIEGLSVSEVTKERAAFGFKYGEVAVQIKLDRDYDNDHRDRIIEVKGNEGRAVLDYETGAMSIETNTDEGVALDGEKAFAGGEQKSSKTALDLELEAFINAIKTRTQLINSAELTGDICRIVPEINKLSDGGVNYS